MQKNLLLVIAIFSVAGAFGQKSYWKAISEKQALSQTKSSAVFSSTFRPGDFKLFSLDEARLQNALSKAALRSVSPVNTSGVVIQVPLSDGTIRQFRIAESPVMQPQLQAKYCQIKSYVGEDINDASLRIYFDFTTAGFHAMILSPNLKTVYINPAVNGKGVYSVFDRGNLPENKHSFDCRLDEVISSQVQGNAQTLAQSDAKLRTYRFSVAVGGEFSKLCFTGNETTNDQKKASVLSVLVTDLVRTNAIYETDFGVHLNYVNKEDDVIFLDGKNDPFQSSTLGYFTGRWNTQAQQTNDKYIGTANYDIGHLLMGFPTGGNAGCIGCVCNAPDKGAGATGFTDDITTDPFVVDFWDHEIGHQFGGNHTFDYSNEGTIAQMEPGSGSTIMGYAGTTGATDIQPHSDPYFHAVSIQQIYTYISTGKGATCAVMTGTGNIVPVVSASNDYTIPKSTPFELTGTATDGNGSDLLTYCWEQYDVFKSGTSDKYPSATSTTGPVFRSYRPTTSNQRYFPALPSILDGTNQNKWEVLPSVARTLNFRLTVRDNHAGGGTTATDDIMVTVDNASGPFTITAANTPLTAKGGVKANLTWNVANTNKAPVNCANVKILMSTDGGQTFPIVLLASTPNDGAATITVPDIATTQGRIKVMAIGNIFFDINDADFTIKAKASVVNDNFIASNIAGLNTTDGKATVQPNPAKSFTTVFFHSSYAKCNISVTNTNGKVVYTKALSAVEKGTSQTVSLSGLSKGVYFLKVTTEKGSQTEKIVVE